MDGFGGNRGYGEFNENRFVGGDFAGVRRPHPAAMTYPYPYAYSYP